MACQKYQNILYALITAYKQIRLSVIVVLEIDSVTYRKRVMIIRYFQMMETISFILEACLIWIQVLLVSWRWTWERISQVPWHFSMLTLTMKQLTPKDMPISPQGYDFPDPTTNAKFTHSYQYQYSYWYKHKCWFS